MRQIGDRFKITTKHLIFRGGDIEEIFTKKSFKGRRNGVCFY